MSPAICLGNPAWGETLNPVFADGRDFVDADQRVVVPCAGVFAMPPIRLDWHDGGASERSLCAAAARGLPGGEEWVLRSFGAAWLEIGFSLRGRLPAATLGM